jgi:gamma-glutamyltranspeptidase / glutathione hydrolase
MSIVRFLNPVSIFVCTFTIGIGTVPTNAMVRGKQGMVTSAHPSATEAGLAILKQGGNAVDAAVATTLAISVVEPYSAGLGGGGFLLLRSGKTGEIKALDFRERAPLAATRTMYLDAQGNVRPRASIDGYLAVAVPGTVAGLAMVHKQYGKLPWQTVVAPAVQLASQGFVVTPPLAAAIAQQKTLQANPAARQIFTRNGIPLGIGDRLIQTDLANTLKSIAQDPQSFYTGKIGAAIVRDMQTNKGLITQQDLQQYKPIWRSPVCGDVKMATTALRVCSMPPPSSGGVHLLQILNMLSGTDLKALGWHHPDALHQFVETMRIAYADRAEHLGDPDFVKVPVKALISPGYAARRRSEIDPQKARLSSQVKAADPTLLQSYESGDTSHLNVVDKEGNAVSLTFTINLGFGSGVVATGTGVVLNNEMDDFAIAPNTPNAFGLVGRDANAIAPRKTPLSSMTPTIVTQNGQLRMVVGSPGGSTIITTVLQIILNVLVYDMDARQAVSAPRLHHQWLPDRTLIETFGFDPLILANLRQRGHILQERNGWGNPNVIVRTKDNWLEGAADPRNEGSASGY